MAKNNNNKPTKNDEYVKHSGAKMRTSKAGKPAIFAWNYSRRLGMITLNASPQLATRADKERHGIAEGQTIEFVSKTGVVYTKYLCHLNVPLQAPRLATGFYNPASGKLRIPEWGVVASTKANDGGYFGKAGGKASK